MAVNFVSPLSRSLLSLLDPSTNPAGRPGRPPTDSYSAFAPNLSTPSPARHPTSPLYGADDAADDSPVRTPPAPGVPTAGPSPLPSGGGTTAPRPVEGVPVAGPAALFPDPKVKAINDREESEHSLTKERARRRTERDALLAAKSQKAAAATSAARDRNLAASEARRAEGQKKRPQNFNPDGTPKSAKDRVSSGTANDTDKLMALEGPARTAAFASERQKGAASQQAPQDQASSLHAAAMARYDRDARMKKMGLNPSSSIDQARFDDLVHLASR